MKSELLLPANSTMSSLSKFLFAVAFLFYLSQAEAQVRRVTGGGSSTKTEKSTNKSTKKGGRIRHAQKSKFSHSGLGVGVTDIAFGKVGAWYEYEVNEYFLPTAFLGGVLPYYQGSSIWALFSDSDVQTKSGVFTGLGFKSDLFGDGLGSGAGIGMNYQYTQVGFKDGSTLSSHGIQPFYYWDWEFVDDWYFMTSAGYSVNFEQGSSNGNDLFESGFFFRVNLYYQL